MSLARVGLLGDAADMHLLLVRLRPPVQHVAVHAHVDPLYCCHWHILGSPERVAGPTSARPGRLGGRSAKAPTAPSHAAGSPLRTEEVIQYILYHSTCCGSPDVRNSNKGHTSCMQQLPDTPIHAVSAQYPSPYTPNPQDPYSAA